jgi:hypothetical protein
MRPYLGLAGFETGQFVRDAQTRTQRKVDTGPRVGLVGYGCLLSKT